MTDDDAEGVRHEQRRRRRARGHHHPIIGVIVVAPLVLVAVAAAALVIAAPTHVRNSCDLAHARPRVTGANSFLYAGDGRRLGSVPTPRNREPVALAKVSHWMATATVAIEDRRFWEHGALDYQGILRSVIANLRAQRVIQG